MDELNYEKYLKFKEATSNKTYFNKFKDLEKGLSMSTFGFNSLSIFLAYFFFYDIISKAFSLEANNILLSVFIVMLLILFEGLKRKVFNIFSIEAVKVKGKIFTKKMFLFIASTMLIISGSFYFSMNGAKEIMNKEVVIEQTYNNNWDTKSIKISKPYDDNLKELRKQNTIHVSNISKDNDNITDLVKKGWRTIEARNSKTENVKLLTENKKEIALVKAEKDKKLLELKEELSKNKSSNKESNNSNIYIFLTLSAIIEIIILTGIFYGHYFRDRCSDEYFVDVVKSPNFQSWKTYNDITDIIFQSVETKVGKPVTSSKILLEIIELEEYDISKKQLDNCFKMFAYLNITKTEGNRRILKMPESEIRTILKEHYKIN